MIYLGLSWVRHTIVQSNDIFIEQQSKEVIGISVLMCTDSFTEQIGWVPKELFDDILALAKRSAINLESLIVKWISGKEEKLSETFTKLRIKLNICGPNC